MVNEHDKRGRFEGIPSPSSPSDEYGVLQEIVDESFASGEKVTRLDLIMRAQMFDVGDDLMEVVELLPAGTYSRGRLCDQLNSIITAHGWGYVYGTVE